MLIIVSLITSCIVSTQNCKAQSNKDYTVQTHVVVSKTPPSISIRWPIDQGSPTVFNIYRKAKSDLSWGSIIGTTSGIDTIWTDKNVVVGQEYEYSIQKLNGTTLLGITYLLCGIEVPVIHNRGAALIVVEKTLAAAIIIELNNYMKDIAADGWEVFTIQASKTDSVQKVKREINKIEKSSGGLKSLILLGHVPVPYSGNFGKDTLYKIGNACYPPDGHVEHYGCWPADVYYAVDYDKWTDTATNTVAVRTANKNLPGDGKFDNTAIPNEVNYYLGRIDLSDLPTFALSESELTKQYFKKAHDFRYKITKTVEKGVVDDRFDVKAGANGSLAWRNFTAMFGPKNIIDGDYLQNCKTQNLLFGYGAGGGTYTDCGRVCSTDSFKKYKPAIFNMLFGSNFGDWDNINNLLRAPLAAAENGLTNAWSGRPHWQNHSMALGYPIGYSAMVTQNNKNLYTYNYAANAVHINLMGDPTLRLHSIAPPTNVIASSISNNTKVKLDWTASKESGNLGYYIYRCNNPYGKYLVLNSIPLQANTFTDDSPFIGKNYYFIKTVKLTTSASGSYYNTSSGADAEISGITGGQVGLINLKSSSISVFPNPSKNFITINIPLETNPNSFKIEICNTIGQCVKSILPVFDSNFNTQPIGILELPKGIYSLKFGNYFGKFIKD